MRRANVALTSIALYDEKEAFKEHLTREDINNAVKMAFNRWVKSRKPSLTGIRSPMKYRIYARGAMSRGNSAIQGTSSK